MYNISNEEFMKNILVVCLLLMAFFEFVVLIISEYKHSIQVKLAIRKMDEVSLMTKIFNIRSNLKVAEFFNSKGFKTFAICGLENCGKCFIDILKSNNMEPSYGIDEKIVNWEYEFDIYPPDVKLPCVDVIILCIPIFDVIRRINMNNSYNIVYLGDLIKEFNTWLKDME
jgi:hypothetical protein